MLLAQKSYCEGALALELYCAKLVDELHTGDDDGASALAPAARSADADRQELAERVVPGSEQPGDPGARRLRLHARLSGRAVLARQPPEHDPRGHARHPGARPARPQGRDGRRRRPRRRPRGDRRDDRARASDRGARRARAGAAPRRRRRRGGDARRLVDRRSRRSARQRDALPAGVRPPRPGLDLARRRDLRGRRRARATRSAAASPPAATSSATSCRASAPGSASSRRATTPAATLAEESF